MEWILLLVDSGKTVKGISMSFDFLLSSETRTKTDHLKTKNLIFQPQKIIFDAYTCLVRDFGLKILSTEINDRSTSHENVKCFKTTVDKNETVVSLCTCKVESFSFIVTFMIFDKIVSIVFIRLTFTIWVIRNKVCRRWHQRQIFLHFWI